MEKEKGQERTGTVDMENAGSMYCTSGGYQHRVGFEIVTNWAQCI